MKDISTRKKLESQLRQQSIFNDKIETKQTSLTEESNQFEVQVQYFESNFNVNNMERVCLALIRHIRKFTKKAMEGYR